MPLDQLVAWLGPEGAIAGLEHSELTIAELVELEPSIAAVKASSKLKRGELIKQIVAAVRSRVSKTSDELMAMSANDLKAYFVEIKASREELLSLLLKLDIRPGSAAKKNLSEFAAQEISDIGMYRRVATGALVDQPRSKEAD